MNTCKFLCGTCTGTFLVYFILQSPQDPQLSMRIRAAFFNADAKHCLVGLAAKALDERDVADGGLEVPVGRLEAEHTLARLDNLTYTGI